MGILEQTVALVEKKHQIGQVSMQDVFLARGSLATAYDAVGNNLAVYNLARKQYEVGQIELLNLLQLQTGWIGARVGLLNVQNLRLAERINLHLALGGSFEEAQAAELTADP